ncbi:MAG: hypothetical protein KGI50_01640 [Patescibacteria group bacterium]|nr:hypothetical protein [Patescibacteria group bacterium]MDE2437954.1 hypothetical protein [Patescibacteria group bacterium]
MNTKAIAITAIALMVVATVPVFAQTSSTGTTLSQPMVLQVGSAGKTLLRGTIDSVGTGTLTVKSWGGSWTINVGTGTHILPNAVGNDLTQFKAGDFVGVQGVMSQSGNWTIDATLVRDWTYRQTVRQEQKQNTQTEHKIISSNRPRNYVGVASNVNGSTFTLTVSGTADTVNIASGAEVLNRNRIAIQASNIQNGDSVRVWGVNTSGTITAQIVRDMSLYAKASKQ